jgi:hypothetical protein
MKRGKKKCENMKEKAYKKDEKIIEVKMVTIELQVTT